MNTFIFSESGGSVGIGFAIPINRVKQMMSELKEHGQLRRVQLDFEVIDITPHVQRALGLGSRVGALVYRVASQGPASAAGIQPGDVIVRVNKHPVENRRDFLVQVLGGSGRKKFEIELVRESKTVKVDYAPLVE
jgi:S1-C subfamily serine protease